MEEGRKEGEIEREINVNVHVHRREREREQTPWCLSWLIRSTTGSCADIMHSAQPFRNGFKQDVIAVIIRDVVQGLEYLHNLGYVHRYYLHWMVIGQLCTVII